MNDMSTLETTTLLASGLVGRLAMVDPQGRPYTIPMRYVWHDGAIYVRLGFDGRKQEALDHSRHVCFETDECWADFSRYASVLVEGTLHDVTDDAEKKRALVAYNDKYHRLCGIPTPGPDPVIRGVAMRRIAPTTITGRKQEPPPAALARRIVPLLRKEIVARKPKR